LGSGRVRVYGSGLDADSQRDAGPSFETCTRCHGVGTVTAKGPKPKPQPPANTIWITVHGEGGFSRSGRVFLMTPGATDLFAARTNAIALYNVAKHVAVIDNSAGAYAAGTTWQVAYEYAPPGSATMITKGGWVMTISSTLSAQIIINISRGRVCSHQETHTNPLQ
jgi:hypothetical protein